MKYANDNLKLKTLDEYKTNDLKQMLIFVETYKNVSSLRA